MGELLGFAYPEMSKAAFPEKTSTATVQIKLTRQKKNGHPIGKVYGKVAVFVRDVHGHSINFRAGSLLFNRTKEMGCLPGSEGVIELDRSVVAVPTGWILRIEVDLYAEIPNTNQEKDRHLKVNFDLEEGCLDKSQCLEGTGIQIEAHAKWMTSENKQCILSQLGRPQSPAGKDDGQSSGDDGQSSRNNSQGSSRDNDQGSSRDSDQGSSRDNDQGGSSRDNNDAQSHGRPLVEVLAMRADLTVIGTQIIVVDGKLGHIIYKKEEKGEEGMAELVLTGPCTGISARVCFGLKIEIPNSAPIKWGWNCSDPKYAAQVDASQPSSQVIRAPDGRKIAEVTYAVMSNALKATVTIVLQLRDGHSIGGGNGKVTARIGGFELSSLLFSRADVTGQCCSYTTDKSQLVLQLDRNLVAVPCGEAMYIGVDLPITTPERIYHFKACFNCTYGLRNRGELNKDGDWVGVNIGWYPVPGRTIEVREVREVVYTITDDQLSYVGFIMDLRRFLAQHPDSEDIMDRHRDSIISSTREHPILAKQLMDWIHVKVQVIKNGQRLSTTLIIRDDTLDVDGFINHEGDCYEFEKGTLPSRYNSKLLDWDCIQNGDRMNFLMSMILNKNVASDAVCALSGYCESAHSDVMDPWVAMEVLRLIVYASAIFNRIGNSIASGWNIGIKLPKEAVECYMLYWERISVYLLEWKSNRYRGWGHDSELESVGIKSPKDALDVVHLVLRV